MTIEGQDIPLNRRTYTPSILKLLGSDLHLYITHQIKMNKEIKSTTSIKNILTAMERIPSFKLRFDSAQDYVEYMLKRDLEIMKKNPTKKL